MLAKPEWFQKRKYSGWGMNPITWQGWAYVAGFIIIVTIIQSIPFLSTGLKNVFSAVLVLFFLLDTLKIMATFKKDELEEKNEATAERNAAWAMVVILTVGIIYQAISSENGKINTIDPFLIAALIAGFVAKATSYLILEKK